MAGGQDGAKAARPALWADAGWRAVAAAFLFNGLLFGVWASRVPAFKARFDLDPAALGLLLLALAGGAIASFPVAGILSEKWGAERLALRCALAYGPALMLVALAPSPLWLGVALAVFGAFHGAMDVAMNGWAARVERGLGRSTMSIFHAMYSLGAGLGAASGYGAGLAGLPPAVHFAAVAAGGAALCLAVILRGMKGVAAPAPAAGAAPLLAWPSGALVLVGLVAFASSVGEGAMADWSAVYLATAIGATEAQAALGYAAFSATMVLTRLAGGALVTRFGPVAVTRASGATAAAGMTLALTAPGLGAALAGFALVGVGYAVLMPLVFSRAANDPVMRPGPALASVATLGYGGMLVGPAVVGFIAQATSLPVAFAGLALLALLPVALGHRMATPPYRPGGR
ncbi:MFS transporter [Roseicyclus persicicus]|uniref:MFS transporter n=1 Tax=Roseicyclus persicicus TaxID=2650661 RepID=A0A7X6K041_9RHOB|nr:MFS transporter [Roseibacterium persicicum]NKX45433.1 MFS transporter [Roseibacterium persicicum]